MLWFWKVFSYSPCYCSTSSYPSPFPQLFSNCYLNPEMKNKLFFCLSLCFVSSPLRSLRREVMMPSPAFPGMKCLQSRSVAGQSLHLLAAEPHGSRRWSLSVRLVPEQRQREQSEAGVLPACLSPSAVVELCVYPQASHSLLRLLRQGSNLCLGSLSLRPQNFCPGHEEGSNK